MWCFLAPLEMTPDVMGFALLSIIDSPSIQGVTATRPMQDRWIEERQYLEIDIGHKINTRETIIELFNTE